MTMRRWWFVAVGVALLIVGVVSARTFGRDARQDLCPVNGQVATAFALEHARDFRQAIPGMTGRTPELESSDAPAYVVIYSGPVEVAAFGGPGHDARGQIKTAPEPRRYVGVVCVVLGDIPIVYSDIDTAGAHPVSP
jgi:hypothetical protein